MEIQQKKVVKKFIDKNIKIKKKKVNYEWIIEIMLIGFLISLIFSVLSENILPNTGIIIGMIIILFFISLGVVFDMVGIAVTSASPKPFHSMASRKVRGSALAVKIINNQARVSSFLNDVVGDICGIISGSAGVIISLKVASKYNIEVIYITLLITSIIAALTIGGKALGKAFAVNKSNIIVYEFAKLVSFFYKMK